MKKLGVAVVVTLLLVAGGFGIVKGGIMPLIDPPYGFFGK